MTTSVNVRVISCLNLKRADVLTKSDPYVEVCCHDKRGKTRVVQNNPNPVFNEVFKFPLNLEETSKPIIFRVFNDSKFRKHDKIGEATIHLKSLMRPPPLTSGTLTVDLYMKSKGVTGQLQIEITIPAPNSEGSEVTSDTANVEIFQEEEEEGPGTPAGAAPASPASPAPRAPPSPLAPSIPSLPASPAPAPTAPTPASPKTPMATKEEASAVASAGQSAPAGGAKAGGGVGAVLGGAAKVVLLGAVAGGAAFLLKDAKLPALSMPSLSIPVLGKKTHTVKSGDNIYALARQSGQSVDSVLKKNPDLQIHYPYSLPIGTKIKL